jgi:hypothetical protein
MIEHIYFVIGLISYILGAVSFMVLKDNEVDLEKRVALLILAGWFSFSMMAYFQERELNLFFNAAGLGAVGNLLGIKTSDLIKSVLRK